MSTLIFLHLVYAGGLLAADLISALFPLFPLFPLLHPAAEGGLPFDRVQPWLHPAGRFPIGFADHAQALHPGACAGCSMP